MFSLLISTPAWHVNAPTTVSQAAFMRTSLLTAVMPAVEEEAKQRWLARAEQSYSWGQAAPSTPSLAAPAESAPAESSVTLVHAPFSYFALDQLVPKGTRREQGSLVDVGEPCDFTRPLVPKAKWNGAAVGSWACSEGGWDSPKLRPTTETFLVIDGEGSVTDTDGMIHRFGPNDVVVLPKHWSGRWDITRQIHKVWVVHDHPDVPGAADGVVRAVVAPVWSCFGPELRSVDGSPASAGQTIYDIGPTKVGFWSCSPGSFFVEERSSAECFWVVDGVFFLTNPDGSARRCAAGDTVVLPAGWAGHWDVLEPVRKVSVEVE